MKIITVPRGDSSEQWLEQHVYVCTKDNKELFKHLKFRNYLRKHPIVASEYGKLKLSLANTAKSRAEYTAGKSEFINECFEKTD